MTDQAEGAEAFLDRRAMAKGTALEVKDETTALLRLEGRSDGYATASSVSPWGCRAVVASVEEVIRGKKRRIPGGIRTPLRGRIKYGGREWERWPFWKNKIGSSTVADFEQSGLCVNGPVSCRTNAGSNTN